ncbi:MAG: ATP-binding protein [Pyrinomonadaceae bacterium]|nr:ATP-binding protein [Pyrinomonadaceae bacterium]
MTGKSDWQKANDDYLSAALSWLQLRLERLAPSPAQERWENPGILLSKIPTVTPPKPKPKGFFLTRWMRRLFSASSDNEDGEGNEEEAEMSEVSITQALLPSGDNVSVDERIAGISAALLAAEQVEMPPALVMLARLFELSRFEQQLLLLCAARDLDTRHDERCAQAQGDPHRRYPTFALAMMALDEPTWDALSPERPLRYWHLLEIQQAAGQSLTTSALRADERIVNYIKGLNYLDDRVARLINPLGADDETSELPPSQQSAVEFIGHEIEKLVALRRLPVVQLTGRDSGGKQQVAARVAGGFRRILYRLPAELLPSHTTELETFIRLLERETRLLPVALYVDANEIDKASEGRGLCLHRFLMSYEGLVFLDSAEPLQATGLQTLSVNIQKPTAKERYAVWSGDLGDSFKGLAQHLAIQFNLDIDSIRRITATTERDQRAIWQACRAQLRPRLEGLAQHLEPRKVWDKLDPRDPKQRDEVWSYLVLPKAEKRLLRQIAAQVEHRFQVYEDWQVSSSLNRGLGISALFAGESGTGKTFAAEVLAKVLDLDLYRIDLSSVISKYIGETEKNLRRLFDTAEDSGVILLFDEADALYGKRSEVKDSHDRYANIEINYLLQRLEAYNGLAILATNLKSALDQAFMRRLRFVVNFPFPGPAERMEIWRKAFPEGIPLDKDLDFERLAQLNLTGGNIHSIAINAAFLAAERASPVVTLADVLEAARDELRKLDKQFSEADFRVG